MQVVSRARNLSEVGRFGQEQFMERADSLALLAQQHEETASGGLNTTSTNAASVNFHKCNGIEYSYNIFILSYSLIYN